MPSITVYLRATFSTRSTDFLFFDHAFCQSRLRRTDRSEYLVVLISLSSHRNRRVRAAKALRHRWHEAGDAWKAAELLVKAEALAEETISRLTRKEIEIAEQRLEVDKTVSLIRALAVHKESLPRVVIYEKAISKGRNG